MDIFSLAASVHRGEKGLGQTYWLWLALPLAVLRFGIYAVTIASLETKVTVTIYALFFGLQILFLAWLVYFGIGALRSAKKAKSRFWAGVAAVVIYISFVLSPIVFAANVVATLTGEGEEYQSEIAAVKAQLPKRLDGITTMVNVVYADKSIVYFDQIDQSAIPRMHWDMLRGFVLKAGCAAVGSDLKSGGLKSVSYQYVSPAGQKLFLVVLTASACTKAGY